PADERNFELHPTPIPELPESALLATIPQEQIDQFRARIEADAKKRAENAQNRIDDWLTECLYQGEMRKVIEDCARLGTGIIKGPFPVKRKKRVVTQENGVLAMVLREDITPASRAVSPWNFYPDPSCGEDINNGAYVWELDR